MMDVETLNREYMAKLKDAITHEETATFCLRQGRREEAVNGYKEASILYAQAADLLLGISDHASWNEQRDYQNGIRRLLDCSNVMKERAKTAGELVSSVGGDVTKTKAEDGDNSEFAPVSEIPDVHFDDIIGMEDAKRVVNDEIIKPVKFREVYARFNKGNRGGLLLYGLPGGGKTMMAKAISAEAGIPFYEIKCSDIVTKYVGEPEKKVKELFDAARKDENAVVFFDEVEAIAGRRGGESSILNRLVPELLAQMDGFSKGKWNIIVIFATNRPFDIDPAFLRMGRVPNHCYVPLPDCATRLALLEKETGKLPCEGNLKLEELAKKMVNFSCADVVNLVREASQAPIDREIECQINGEDGGETVLTAEDLNNALQKVHPSVNMKDLEELEAWMRDYGIPIPAHEEKETA